MEEVRFLTQFADKIRLSEFMPSLPQEKIADDPKFEVHLNTEVVEFKKAKGGKLSLDLEVRGGLPHSNGHPACPPLRSAV